MEGTVMGEPSPPPLLVLPYGRTLDIPDDSIPPGAEHLGPMPHVFLADEAFPLRRNIMRPYPGYNTGEKSV